MVNVIVVAWLAKCGFTLGAKISATQTARLRSIPNWEGGRIYLLGQED
jgi:hypothetical protein